MDTRLKPIAVIVPTYNELENIDRMVSALLGLPFDTRVIVVDDASPDGTAGEVTKWMHRAPEKIFLIEREAKLGLGTAYIAGFKKAFTLTPDIIVTMDADFSHDPIYIKRMIHPARDYDLVIGSRYTTGGGVLDSPLHRRLLSRSANGLARAVLGLAAADVTAGFRAYRCSELQKLDLDQIFSNGYSFLIETLYICQTCGWRIVEIPIMFKDRSYGSSKISRTEIAKAFYTLCRLFFRRLT